MEEVPKAFIEQANSYFTKFDHNKNDFIEPDELKDLMSDVAKEIGMPLPTDEDVDKIMEDTDINKDQKISREEFVSLFKIIYVMKDINK